MKKFIFLLSLVKVTTSYALITSPTSLDFNKVLVEYKLIQERGKVEPNESAASFQDAKIDIQSLSVTKGLANWTDTVKDLFVRLEYKQFTSGEERVGNQLFYEKDEGENLQITSGFNFVHELDFVAGMYAAYSPLVDFNEEKFSVPRIDIWQLGLTTGIKLNENWFLDGLMHYGSGISNKQNSYILLSQMVGYKWDTVSFKYGPYLEADTQQRKDAKYDAAFSAGSSDRIRSMKYGVQMHLSWNIMKKYILSAGEVQKLGGYDAVATRAYYLAIGGVF